MTHRFGNWRRCYDLIRMAELEKAAQRCRRNREDPPAGQRAEYIIIPQYLETMKSIRMKLEENERGNTTAS